MKTEAAVLWEIGSEWSVEDVELDPPGPGEVLVRWVASGMCHSDEHLVTGDLPMPTPLIGGHEGGGVVEDVGPGVASVAPGDHVVSSFIPSCGRCSMCMSGHGNLCVAGADALAGPGRGSRYHARGKDLGAFCGTATFSRHAVLHERSLVRVDADLPLDKACLVACGVTTGWGSAVHRGEVKPGETVVVVGVGGVGTAAVQGARLAGAERIVAVDIVPFKLEQAKHFGATHVASSIEEAVGVVSAVTHNAMADVVVMTLGVGKGELMAGIMALGGKRARVVVTNMFALGDNTLTMSPLDLITMEKSILGSLYGTSTPSVAVPKLLSLYRSGLLDLDHMVTRTYPLHGINQGYQDMRDGLNIRGVIVHE
jgi:S-(hydroxymethyl)glutathione dehydrogenase/alcohol dehydrogenase